MLLFLLFLGCFFLGCHELNALLRRFSRFGADPTFFEAQQIGPLRAYIQDIEVLVLHCQQKNVDLWFKNFYESRCPACVARRHV